MNFHNISRVMYSIISLLHVVNTQLYTVVQVLPLYQLHIAKQVNGVRASYNLSGRRLEGELSFAYNTLTYRARLTQVHYKHISTKTFQAKETCQRVVLCPNDFSRLVPRLRETSSCWSFSWRTWKGGRWR